MLNLALDNPGGAGWRPDLLNERLSDWDPIADTERLHEAEASAKREGAVEVRGCDGGREQENWDASLGWLPLQPIKDAESSDAWHFNVEEEQAWFGRKGAIV